MREPRSISSAYRAGSSTVEVDRSLAAVAARQHGVLTRAQIRSAGLGSSTITRRVQRGLLVRVHPGVYTWGHGCLSSDGAALAAVLAGGPHATLGGLAAMATWGLRGPSRRRPEVFVPRPRGAALQGVRIRRIALAPNERTTLRGIPITTVARTVADAAGLLGRPDLEEVVHLALARGLVDEAALFDALPGRGRSGGAKLRSVLAERHPQAERTRSAFERRVLPQLRGWRLPAPLVNARIPGADVEVDLVWWEARLAVELDSWTHHGSPTAFEEDRRRSAELQLAGWTVLRFTWRQVRDQPAWVAGHIRANLARSRPHAEQIDHGSARTCAVPRDALRPAGPTPRRG